MTNVRDHVAEYLRRGWQCIPLKPRKETPISEKWGDLRLSANEIKTYFSIKDNVGIAVGEPSGWLVDVDLDCPEAMELADQYLPATTVTTGRLSAPRSHRWYIAVGAITKKHADPFTGEMVVELRSTGGQTAVGPSIHPDGERYEILAGKPAVVPVPMLTACVKALAEAALAQRYPQAPVQETPQTSLPTARYESVDDIERRAIAYLDAMPPAISHQGGHGKTFAAATVIVHGFAIAPDRALSILQTHYNPRCEPPWSEKELQHKVNEAATKSHDKPYGWLRDAEQAATIIEPVDLAHFNVRVKSNTAVASNVAEVEPATTNSYPDPGPIPDDMYRIPGFVSELMDHCLETAPYPNVTLAFCGALALQAMLAGRKVRDPGDNRTNLYLLGLAHSAAGKDWPRKLNTKILFEIGMANCLGERFASGEGIQDSLFLTPSMLYQTDEIDGILQSIKQSKDARYESIMSTLLTMYSSANSAYPMRRKANVKESPGAIDQPSLVVFGTAIPNHYYDALSEKMLTNGVFARMLIFECGQRGQGQEPTFSELPVRMLETAKWWSEFQPGRGNLESWHPVPIIVSQDDEAKSLLSESRIAAELEYTKAEQANDAVGTTVWGRVSEQTRKLALLYAVSRDHKNPVIDRTATQWASQLVDHQTRRMLFMASTHVSESDFDKRCQQVLALLTEWRKNHGSQWMTHRVLTRKYRWPPNDHDMVRESLVDRELIETEKVSTRGRPKYVYRLIDNARGES